MKLNLIITLLIIFSTLVSSQNSFYSVWNIEDGSNSAAVGIANFTENTATPYYVIKGYQVINSSLNTFNSNLQMVHMIVYSNFFNDNQILTVSTNSWSKVSSYSWLQTSYNFTSIVSDQTTDSFNIFATFIDESDANGVFRIGKFDFSSFNSMNAIDTINGYYSSSVFESESQLYYVSYTNSSSLNSYVNIYTVNGTYVSTNVVKTNYAPSGAISGVLDLSYNQFAPSNSIFGKMTFSIQSINIDQIIYFNTQSQSFIYTGINKGNGKNIILSLIPSGSTNIYVVYSTSNSPTGYQAWLYNYHVNGNSISFSNYPVGLINLWAI